MNDMKTMEKNEGCDLIAQCFGGRDSFQLEKNMNNFDRKFKRFEDQMFQFINTNILTDGRKLSDIWSTAYMNVFEEVTSSGEVYGFWILKHIIDNFELYSDQTKVNELRNSLDQIIEINDEKLKNN
jgi:hypothetical protein